MTCNAGQGSLSPLPNMNFRLLIHRLPNVSFWAHDVPLPSLSLPTGTQPTAFQRIPQPGNSLVFDPLRIEFVLNEDMSNYLEIYDWMRALGFPNGFEEYDDDPANIKSDMTLMILGSNQTPKVEFNFIGAFPIRLGDGINFTTESPETTYIKASATFAYEQFNYNIL